MYALIDISNQMLEDSAFDMEDSGDDYGDAAAPERRPSQALP